MAKPSVLVLGGVGFIGRHLVTHLVENDLTSFIRVADKALVQTSNLTARQEAAFKNVEFKQANLSRDATIDKIFDREGGFDYVFNCAAMTKCGQDEFVYDEHIFQVGVKCAKKAAEIGVKKYLELSTAQVYASDKKASTEESKIKPWTRVAEYKWKVEQEIAAIPNLNYVIVRPATVYGPGDRLGLMPRLICGAVYKKLGETMKFLWTKELRINTVHVQDVVEALWLLAEQGINGQVYNLSDKGDSSQGSINDLLSQLFGIQTGFFGTMLSNVAKMAMTSATETSNEKHMQPWSEMCRESNVTNTPFSPYLDKELLYNNSLCVNGSKIEGLGFVYKQPTPTVENLREAIQEAVAMNLFPDGYLV
jgi:nucleoside-diphosphate-sugar epimerase